MKITCELCPHHCMLSEGQVGFCKARSCFNGKIICDNYGKITSIAIDPIEKKTLMNFYPGSNILSIGSYGCNLHCPFCQNSDISQEVCTRIIELSPKQLIKTALEYVDKYNNIGIAYTYNEPFISYEYVYDCARLAHEHDLKNVFITNGMICEEPLKKILPYIDAMNVDLKGFTQKFYDMVKGYLETVKNTIRIASKSCHVEVTTLIIPCENDSDNEIAAISKWLSEIDKNIPYHISRFFPIYQMTDKHPTPVKTIYHLAEVARKNLVNVYTGNC
ncbi:MAG: AmmeMemoRadiSam system radical SAM enzyme [Bacteroidales bacterium]|jgi:pyruvate formate lyase activating enzyme